MTVREPRARPKSGWGGCTRPLCKCRASDSAIELLAEMNAPRDDEWRWHMLQIIERAMLEDAR